MLISRRVPLFTFFGTMRHFFERKKFKNYKFFFQKNVLRFLSLRYSADFRRSRLVSFHAVIVHLACTRRLFICTQICSGRYLGDMLNGKPNSTWTKFSPCKLFLCDNPVCDNEGSLHYNFSISVPM